MRVYSAGEFYIDSAGTEYYQATNGIVFEVRSPTMDINTLGDRVDSLPADAELLLMCNGGIYPIIAKRLEYKAAHPSELVTNPTKKGETK